MNITSRRLYFLFIVILFLIITYLIILFASGWRFDYETNNFVKVGSLIIETEPSNANIVIDGSQLEDKTPFRKNNMVPGDYHLIISKDNYYDWTKTVSIKSAEAEIISGVVLLAKQDSPTLLYPEFKIQSLFISPDKKIFSIYYNNTLEFISMDDFTSLVKIKLENKINNVIWSQNSNQIIINTDKNEFLLYDIHNASEYINIGIKFNLNIKSLFWDSAEEDVIFINADGKFYRINTFQQTKNEIFSHDDVIYVYNNGIYFISGDGSISILNADGDIINTLPDINADDIIFFQYKGKYLPFSTINSDVLYLYDTKQNTFNIINDHLTNLNWSANGEKILFNNNHEIFIYDINTSEKNLVVRTSTEISSVDWLANENYIIYYQNNQIIMTESWNNNANVYKITVDDVFQSISNDNHTKIFLLSNEGLYSLNY